MNVFLYFLSINLLFRSFIISLGLKHIFHWRLIAMGVANDIVAASTFFLIFLLLKKIVRKEKIVSILFILFGIIWSFLNYVNYEFVFTYNRLLPFSWFGELKNNTSSFEDVFSIVKSSLNLLFFAHVIIPTILSIVLCFYFKSCLQTIKKRYVAGILILGISSQILTLEPDITPILFAPVQNQVLKYWYYDYDDSFVETENRELSEFSELFKQLVVNPEIKGKSNLPKVKSKNPNIIFFQLENFRAFEIGAYGSKLNLTPNFDRYAKKGILFKQIYSAGWATKQGQFSSLCGGITLRKGVFTDYPDQKSKCLPDYLKEEGYDNWWFHGQSAAYDRQGYFMKNHQVDHIMDRLSFPSDAKVLGWGLSDMDLVKHSLNHMKEAKPPFFMYLQTQTNHVPFESPKEFFKDRGYGDKLNKYLSTFEYTDYIFGYFMDEFRKTPQGKNSIVVVFGDHGNGMEFIEKDRVSKYQTLQRYQIPFLIVYPENMESIASKEMDILGSESDILPTLLDILDIPQTFPTLGKSLLRSYEHRFAKGNVEGLWVTNGNKIYLSHRSQKVFSMKGDVLPIVGEDKKWFQLINELHNVQSWIVSQKSRSIILSTLEKKGWSRY